MDKKELLKLLDKEEIQAKILDIVSECSLDKIDKKNELEIDDLKSKNKALKKELEESMKLIEKLKSIICGKEDALQKSQNTIEKNQEELKIKESDRTALNEALELVKKELYSYKSIFQEEMAIFEKYNKLSDKTKKSLGGIFRDETLQGFFACGVQDKNINHFYEYVKNELIEDNNDINDLIVIFNFFLERYMRAYPNYNRLNTQEKDDFSNDEHIKIQGSASGSIGKIYLQGWKNIKTNKVVEKSLVKLT